MRVAVTGRTGQVARSLVEIATQTSIEVVCLGRPELDLARPDTVLPALIDAAPDLVVSAAAYTAVDKAESEPEIAHAVNVVGAKVLAEAAARLGVPILHLSTDYVFDGELGRPFVESDAVSPLNVYGRTKLEGEMVVAAHQPDHVILRTAWIYSPFGRNFMRSMLSLAAEREVVRIVADQIGCPTSAHDIARGVLQVAENLLTSPGDVRLRGIFHMAGGGAASWADFAEAIFAESKAAGGPSASVERIGTSDYPTPAKRPRDTRLDCSKLAGGHGLVLPEWQASLRPALMRLLAGI